LILQVQQLHVDDVFCSLQSPVTRLGLGLGLVKILIGLLSTSSLFWFYLLVYLLIVFGCSLQSPVVDVADASEKRLAHWSEMIHRAALDVSVLTEQAAVHRLRMSGQR